MDRLHMPDFLLSIPPRKSFSVSEVNKAMFRIFVYQM